MARHPRLQFAEVALHIVQRGINRKPCFFAEEAYHCYLHRLKEAARDCRCTSGADERAQAFRAQLRPHLDTDAAIDIRQALQLGMLVGQDRFAELVCAKAGIRFDTGKHGQMEGKPQKRGRANGRTKEFRILNEKEQ